jgi:uncharacterized protein YceH (UPF0502 family)
VEPLQDEEVRVLGCLAEKEATVPDSYPLTLNALRQACNQSTSRDPVVGYDDLTVQRALDSLKAAGLVRFVHPSHGERTTRFRHALDEKLGLDRRELALLTVLALRGAQTVPELRTRTERQHAFADVGEVEASLRALAARDEPLVVAIPRQPGQREGRWMHQLGGPVDVEAFATAHPAGGAPRAAAAVGPDLAEEVAALRARVERIERELGLDLSS